jgi:acetyl esterase
VSAPPAIHPQIAALLADQETPSTDGPVDLAALRAGYLETALRLGGAREPVADVRDLVIDGRLPAQAYEPQRPATPAGAIVWLHGGGWVMGDVAGFEHVCRALANASGHVVVSVEYRLAPEHPFPAAVDDALAAVAWALGHGAGQLSYDASRVIVGGDSAGGNLAAVAARHHRDRVAGQLLVYPATDATMSSTSYSEEDGSPMLSAASMADCYAAYLGAADPLHPDASPLHAPELAGLPPAFVAVADLDVLRDDGLRYAAALRDAGVEVHEERYADMVHGFLRWGGVVDRAGELVRAMGAWSRERLAA